MPSSVRLLTDFKRNPVSAGIGRCVVYIDGLVIWTHKLTRSDCEESGVDESEFFCGRKMKFGLNLQAVCDHKKRCASISVLYGTSTSDHLAFKVSDLKLKQVSGPVFVSPDVCFFGNNARQNILNGNTIFQRVLGQDCQGCKHFLPFSAADHHQGRVCLAHANLEHTAQADTKAILNKEDYGRRVLPPPLTHFLINAKGNVSLFVPVDIGATIGGGSANCHHFFLLPFSV